MATAKLPTTQPTAADVSASILGIPKNEWTANGTTAAGAAVPFSLVVNEAVDASVASTGYLTTENNEVLHYSAVNTGTKTFTIDARAQQGTTAAEIANGSAVGQYLTRDDWGQLAAEVVQMSKTGAGAKGADVASAAALNIGEDGWYFNVTGTTAITSIETRLAGQIIILRFAAALTLTHHATDLILRGGGNVTTAAGDVFIFASEGSGDWREIGRSTTTSIGGTATRHFWVPIASASISAGSPVFQQLAARITGWAFDAAAGERITFAPFLMPADYGSGAVAVKAYLVNGAAGAGNVVVRAYLNAKADAEDLNSTTGESDNTQTVAAPAQNVLKIVTLTSAVTPTAGEVLTLMFERVAADAADTLGNDIYLVGIEVEYTAA